MVEWRQGERSVFYTSSSLSVDKIKALRAQEKEVEPEEVEEVVKGQRSQRATRQSKSINVVHVESLCEYVLFCYKTPAGYMSPLNKNSYETLAVGEYLDDGVIDFWLANIYYNRLSEAERRRTYIYPSQFFTFLMSDNAKRFDESKKWTKNFDIFERDFLVFPVIKHSHWFLLIVCFAGTLGAENENAVILRFDSLLEEKSRTNEYSQRIRKYLSFMANSADHFTSANMKFQTIDTPQQPNETDCGLYLLQNAELFFEVPLSGFKMEGKALEVFQKVVARKRQEIANVIMEKVQAENPAMLAALKSLELKFE